MVHTTMKTKIQYGFFDLIVADGDSWTAVFSAWYHRMIEDKKRKKLINDCFLSESRVTTISLTSKSNSNVVIEHQSLAFHLKSGVDNSSLFSNEIFKFAGILSDSNGDITTKFYRIINGVKQHNCTKWKSRLFINFNDFPLSDQLLAIINSNISKISLIDPTTALVLTNEFSISNDLMILAWLYDKGAHLKAHFDSEKKEGSWNFLINCGASVHFFTKRYTKHPSNRTIIDWKETILSNNDCFFMNELQHGFVGLQLTKEFPFRLGFSVRGRILPLSDMIAKPYFYKKQLQSQPRWDFID